MGIVAEVSELILDLLYPKTCCGCGTWGSYLCSSCLHSLPFYPSPLCPGCFAPRTTLGIHASCKKYSALDGLLVAVHYDARIKKLLHHIKYGGAYAMIPTLASIVRPSASQLRHQADCICAVPLHPTRKRERGFNQSELLARALAPTLQLPYRNLLVRTLATPYQARQHKKQRHIAVQEAFCAQGKTLPHTVILVDDVCTTGSTLSACATALKKGGVSLVYGLVVAHGD